MFDIAVAVTPIPSNGGCVIASPLSQKQITNIKRPRCSYSVIGNVPSHQFPEDQRVLFWRRTMKVCPLPPSHWRCHLSSPSNKRLTENESSVQNVWNLRNRTRRCAGAAVRWQVRSNVPGVKQLLLRTQPQIWKLVHFSEARIADFHVTSVYLFVFRGAPRARLLVWSCSERTLNPNSYEASRVEMSHWRHCVEKG